MKRVQIITGTGEQLYTIVFPYRFFDEDISFVITNWITQKTETMRLSAVEGDSGTLEISFLYEFRDGDSFDAIILKFGTNKLMWKGSLFSTSQVNLRRYRMIRPDEEGVIIL